MHIPASLMIIAESSDSVSVFVHNQRIEARLISSKSNRGPCLISIRWPVVWLDPHSIINADLFWQRAIVAVKAYHWLDLLTELQAVSAEQLKSGM